MKKIIDGLKIGIGIFIVLFIGIYVTKARLPDSNGLTAQPGDKLTVAKFNALLPAGSVVAFNLASCPSGWSAFSQANGRVVVGVGNSSDANSTSNSFTLLQSGGEYTHKLTIAEIPSHNHGYARWSSGRPDGNSLGAGVGFKSSTSPSDSVGGDGYHNNVQPFIGLLYCIKN